MNMKKALRFLCGVLALIMLLCTMVACSNDQPKDPVDPDNSPGDTSSDNTDDDGMIISRRLPTSILEAIRATPFFAARIRNMRCIRRMLLQR